MDSNIDIQTFNALYNESYSNFLRFAIGYVRDQHIAEDFVSESFTTYWEKRKELDEDSNPKAYILTIIRNKCLNHIQHIQIKQRVNNELTEHADWALTISINTLEACNPEHLFSKEIQEIIKTTLEKLPHKTQHAFNLSRNLNLTNKEVAQKMNLSTKSVEYHISKALAQLRISLKDFVYLIPFLYFLC